MHYAPTRGAVVKLRDNQGRLTNQRAIVLKKARPTNFSRAYGPEVIVCELYSDSKQKWAVAHDAAIEGKSSPSRKAQAEKLYADSVDISTKQVGMLDTVGRVKKIPKGCLEALKKSGEK